MTACTCCFWRCWRRICTQRRAPVTSTTVRDLLAKGANPNEYDSLGSTPLHDAAWNGDPDLVKLLLKYKADPNARHKESGSVPLHYAVLMNRLQVVEALLDGGADVNATYRPRTYRPAYRGQSRPPRGRRIPCRTRRVGESARRKRRSAPRTKPPGAVIRTWRSSSSPKAPTSRGGTRSRARPPLHEAAQKGYVDVVVVLLESRRRSARQGPLRFNASR